MLKKKNKKKKIGWSLKKKSVQDISDLGKI